MIKKRIKKIGKLLFLIGVGQLWLLFCNIYNYWKWPEVVLAKLKKDKSQQVLLMLSFLSPIIIYLILRIVWDNYKYGAVLTEIGMIFWIIMSIEAVFLMYLGLGYIRGIWKKIATK